MQTDNVSPLRRLSGARSLPTHTDGAEHVVEEETNPHKHAWDDNARPRQLEPACAEYGRTKEEGAKYTILKMVQGGAIKRCYLLHDYPPELNADIWQLSVEVASGRNSRVDSSVDYHSEGKIQINFFLLLKKLQKKDVGSRDPLTNCCVDIREIRDQNRRQNSKELEKCEY
ncbi:unnamed protein product [Ceratitis capitata]|uniref:(Mediterranean fruit fly) hypothetical protein n=1 Tax=Ceratitis capitata TaxID=7213 RepID=A0A811UK28_CERCA|nr:unnamed protein product [Ceratitis capitata]